jgi:hypothetical protein
MEQLSAKVALKKSGKDAEVGKKRKGQPASLEKVLCSQALLAAH